MSVLQRERGGRQKGKDKVHLMYNINLSLVSGKLKQKFKFPISALLINLQNEIILQAKKVAGQIYM